ncbi:MAG: DUF5110 domain-containing protein [Deltaproteobacteria bacterium]|nr:DUF5110 domain-containing protein [Deltaproteobacteria bacterium]
MSTLTRAIVMGIVLMFFCGNVAAEVKRSKFSNGSMYLVVEILSDNLIHCEVSAIGEGPSVEQALYTSPMVLKKDYDGPSQFVNTGNILETKTTRMEVNPQNLCVSFKGRTGARQYLTTICPDDMFSAFKGVNIDAKKIQSVYGLGQQFKSLGSANGDWVSLGVREGGRMGNNFDNFQNAAVGNVQIPVMYAVGEKNLNWALFYDNVYRQRWDFTVNWWKVRGYGDQLRFYVITGDDLPALRNTYMVLTGTPPVPPKKAFGMWVSEFGYDNFEQIDQLLTGLRNNTFPVDGFVLDLNWFGGIDLNDKSLSRMGRLNWEESADGKYSFPNPDAKIKQYANDHISIAAIEESYLANSEYVDTYTQIPKQLLAFQRTGDKCNSANRGTPAEVKNQFWGDGHMLDWSNPETGKWIHSNRRYPNLALPGVHTHWTDLGEPEGYNAAACYNGVETTPTGQKNEHSDIHNIYNLLWNKSIWDGYVSRQGVADKLGIVNARPFILTRSGAAGTQRFGAAMWSGDIASNLQSLATHMNAQMHMSFSGIDYYSSDCGGFRREVLPHNDKQGSYRGYDSENYTQWFANSAWFDVPVRPHTDNEFAIVNPPYDTAPHLVGKEMSNLVNIRQRYELIPYYYSLAYRAFLYGEPVIAPPVFYYQNDTMLRQMGHEKMIGKDILVGVAAGYGEYDRDVYLPQGKWVNYHTNEWVDSSGEWYANIPEYRSGFFRLPAFVREGAIIPQMAVGTDTKDVFGHRKQGAAVRDELVLRVYAAPKKSAFTLYEDDGISLGYDSEGRPLYQYRTTDIFQQMRGKTVSVTIDSAVDVNAQTPLEGLPGARQNVVKLIVKDAVATGVTLNGEQLPEHSTLEAFRAARSGWFNASVNFIAAKSDSEDVSAVKEFKFTLKAAPPLSSVNFVCDQSWTNPGQSIYVVGDIPELGDGDASLAVKLDPNVYWEYIYNPPPGGNGIGPSQPVWTGVVRGLPVNKAFKWKCILKEENQSANVLSKSVEYGFHTPAVSGYAGKAYGTL